jgi:hypothetical protein
MQFIGDTFPLLMCIAPRRYDAASVQQMADAFEPYYARGERYAVLSVQPPDSIAPGPAERKLITDWVSSRRVRENAARLCVGAAAVTPGSVLRGALTAIMWFWTPPFPLKPVATSVEGIEFCVAQLLQAGVSLQQDEEMLKRKAAEALASILPPASIAPER